MKSPPKWGSLYFNVSWKRSNRMRVVQQRTCILQVGRGSSAPDPSLYYTVSRKWQNRIRGVLKVNLFSSQKTSCLHTIHCLHITDVQKYDARLAIGFLQIWICGKRQTPHTPQFIDRGIRYVDDQMGLPPSKYPPKNQNPGFRSKNIVENETMDL